MSTTAYFPLAETQAGAERSRSMWRRALDAMIESRRPRPRRKSIGATGTSVRASVAMSSRIA